MSVAINLCGHPPFERLTVIEFAGNTASGKRAKRSWRCRCSCGNEVIVTTDHLRSGHTTSCGCAQREQSRKCNTVHGLSQLPEYIVWKGMRDRCNNRNHEHWADYGGRGIRICDRWNDFASFYADMGSRPTESHSIDRTNTNGDYEPGNCVWSTKLEQASNTRRNVFVILDGDKVTLSEACRRLGLTYKQARKRFAEEVRRVQD